MSSRGERELRMTPGTPYLGSQPGLGTVNTDGEYRRWRGFGENVTDTVGRLTHHPILHRIQRIGKLSTCLLVSFAARVTVLINGICGEVHWESSGKSEVVLIKVQLSLALLPSPFSYLELRHDAQSSRTLYDYEGRPREWQTRQPGDR